MLPNYIYSQANCIASSDYYAVCCMNECEDLLVHLEKDIAAPEATPARLLQLVSALPSSSVSAPRTVSATLQSRLEAMASEHGGQVQLHSRLFAQWMHHAYPRECPFPHVSGTTSQASPDTWTDGNGMDAVASKEELKQFASMTHSSSSTQEVDDVHDLMMWTHEEELLVVRAPPAPVSTKGSSFAVAVRTLMMFAAVMSMGYGLVRTTLSAPGVKESSQKFMV